RGDAERVADRAVRRAAPTLTQDPACARHLDDFPGAQKILSDVELGDKLELFFDLSRDRLRSPARVALFEAGKREPPQFLVRGFVRLEAAGKVVAKLVQREYERLRDFPGARDPRRLIGEKLPHLALGAKVSFGVRVERGAGSVERDAFADAMHYVGE